MENQKEKWINNILSSIEGAQRARPSQHLLTKVEYEIYTPEAKIISLVNLRIGIAVSILLITLNLFAIRKRSVGKHFNANERGERPSLLLDFELYE